MFEHLWWGALAWTSVVAEPAHTGEVGDELEPLSVPGKQDGAARNLPLQLGDVMTAARGESDLDLRHAVGPLELDVVSLARASQAEYQRQPGLVGSAHLATVEQGLLLQTGAGERLHPVTAGGAAGAPVASPHAAGHQRETRGGWNKLAGHERDLIRRPALNSQQVGHKVAGEVEEFSARQRRAILWPNLGLPNELAGTGVQQQVSTPAEESDVQVAIKVHIGDAQAANWPPGRGGLGDIVKGLVQPKVTATIAEVEPQLRHGRAQGQDVEMPIPVEVLKYATEVAANVRRLKRFMVMTR